MFKDMIFKTRSGAPKNVLAQAQVSRFLISRQLFTFSSSSSDLEGDFNKTWYKTVIGKKEIKFVKLNGNNEDL